MQKKTNHFQAHKANTVPENKLPWISDTITCTTFKLDTYHFQQKLQVVFHFLKKWDKTTPYERDHNNAMHCTAMHCTAASTGTCCPAAEKKPGESTICSPVRSDPWLKLSRTG
jgi:hypothetical protein